MKKSVLSIAILTTCILVLFISQNVNFSRANPFSVPYVPDIRISYPLTSNDGFVNTTVEFEVYVNIFENQTIDSISYSLDDQPKVNLQDIKVVSYHDIAYANGIPDKIAFKTYTAKMRLDNLSEGPHTLSAFTGNMSTSQSFTVNSHFVIAELKTLSPRSQTYNVNTNIPLTFTANREIQSAHYYVYRGNELVCDQSLSGNTTIGQLPAGDYNLYLFVTTELGKTSETIHFSVSNSNQTDYLAIISGSTVLIVVVILATLILLKKRKHKTTNKAAE